MRWLLGVLAAVVVAVATALSVSTADAQSAPEGDPLAELAALGDAVAAAGPEGGGSIRAKREVDPAITARQNDGRNLEARVEIVKAGKFPNVGLRLKVTKSAKAGPGKDIAKNTDLAVVPRLKVDGGRVSFEDADTTINAGSYYLQSGDKVVVRIGPKKGSYYEAEYIERR